MARSNNNSNDNIDRYTGTYNAWLKISFEIRKFVFHIFFLHRLIYSYDILKVLPELPSWLAAEICRAEHIRREMQCKGTTPRQTPPSPPSTASTSQHDVNSPNIVDTHDHSMESQVADDIIFDHIAPISPKFKKFSDLDRNLQNSADVSFFFLRLVELIPK